MSGFGGVLSVEAPEFGLPSGAGEHERRAFPRLPADALDWLRSSRLKHGPKVEIVDLSSGGALFDTAFPLKPGTRAALDLIGRGMNATTAWFRLLRCHVTNLSGGIVYRGACMFEHGLVLPDSSEATPDTRPAPVVEAPPELPPNQAANWNKLVVRYLDGTLVKGYSFDFGSTRDRFHIVPSIGGVVRDQMVISLTQLKAAFFVRHFAGDAGRVERQTFERWPAGRRMEVTFLDGEVLRGTTLNYRTDSPGFFLTPADPDSNNVRVFVVSTATRSVRFL